MSGKKRPPEEVAHGDPRSVAERVRSVIDIVSAGPSRWGSDQCGCDDCAKLRAKARADIVIELSHLLGP